MKHRQIKLIILWITTTLIIVCSCGQSNSDKTKNHFLNSDSVHNIRIDTKSDTKDFEKLGFKLMREETLDRLKLGLKISDLINFLGEPKDKSKNELWGADGEYHQTFMYSNLGIELDLIGENTADKTISMIKVTSPCDYKTNKGISIGSNFKEVEHAYTDFNNPDFSNSKSLVVGSIYGGLIFSFENGKVNSIFIGASAE